MPESVLRSDGIANSVSHRIGQAASARFCSRRWVGTCSSVLLRASRAPAGSLGEVRRIRVSPSFSFANIFFYELGEGERVAKIEWSERHRVRAHREG